MTVEADLAARCRFTASELRALARRFEAIPDAMPADVHEAALEAVAQLSALAGARTEPEALLRCAEAITREATAGSDTPNAEHVARWCQRCESSGCVEGPEPGWYERECPDCKGTGLGTDRRVGG